MKISAPPSIHNIIPPILSFQNPHSLPVAPPHPSPAMATATLPLRLLSSRTPTLHAAPFLPARTSLSFAASAPRHWRILASAEEAPAPVESEVETVEDVAVPEPVEVQLAAAGAGKDADIFAVVMVGLLLQSCNSDSD